MFSLFKKVDIYLIQILLRFVPQIVGMVFGVLVVRFTGTESFGYYALFLALCNISFLSFSAGVRTHLLRVGDGKLHVLSQLLTLVWWWFFLPFITLYFYFSGVTIFPAILFYFAVLFLSSVEIFMVKMRLEESDIKSILPRLIPAVLTIVLLGMVQPDSIFGVSLLYFLAWSSVLLFCFNKSWGFNIWKIVRSSAVKPFFKASSMMTLSILGSQLLHNIDQIVVTTILGKSAGGEYRIAFSISKIVFPTVSVFAVIYLSRFGKISKGGSTGELRKLFWQHLFLTLFLGCIFFFFSLVFNELLLNYLYGGIGANVVFVSIVLTFSTFISLGGLILAYTLYGVGKENKLVLVFLSGAIFNLLLNILLVPYLGLFGGAYASVLTQLFVAGYCAILVYKSMLFRDRKV